MRKPTLVFVDHDERSVHDIINDLKSRRPTSVPTDELSKVFDFVPVLVSTEGEPHEIADTARKEIRRHHPDAILVDLNFIEDPDATTWRRGADLAKALRDSFPFVPIGVYSQIKLESVDRIELSEYRFHVVIEDLLHHRVKRDEFTNSDWRDLLKRLTALSVAGFPRIFLSHAHADAALASAIQNLLYGALDLRRDDVVCSSAGSAAFAAGSGIKTQSVTGVAHADCVIVLVTARSIASNYVWFEYGVATATGKKIIPLATADGLSMRSETPLAGDMMLRVDERKDLLRLVTTVSRATGADQHPNEEWDAGLEAVLAAAK